MLGEMNRAKKLFHLPPDEPLICTAKVIMVLMCWFFFPNFTNQYKQHRSISWILNLHAPVLMTKRVKFVLACFLLFSLIIARLTAVDESSLLPHTRCCHFLALWFHNYLIESNFKENNIGDYNPWRSAVKRWPSFHLYCHNYPIIRTAFMATRSNNVCNEQHCCRIQVEFLLLQLHP